MDSIELDLSDVKPTKSGYPKKILTEEECEKILEHINKEATKKLNGTKLKEMRTKLNWWRAYIVKIGEDIEVTKKYY